MSNSKKIIIIVTAICAVSLLATLNLIRKDEEVRMSDGKVSDGSTKTDQKSTLGVTEKSETSSPASSQSAVTPTVQKNYGDADSKPQTQVTQQSGASSQAEGDQQAGQPATVDGSVSSKPQVGSNVPVGTDTLAAANQKKAIKFPGIEQSQGRVMVRDVRHKGGEGEDQVSVTLTVTDDNGEIAGRVWVVGEYVQRGTTGVMYMPSSDDLSLSPDGKPQNPNSGQSFSMRFNTEKKFSIKRPGFEGEELTAIRVGVWDKGQGKLHIARMLIKNGGKKAPNQRAKVEVQ